MKISTQTIKFLNEKYHSAGDPAPDGVDALVTALGAQLGAVEEAIPFGERFKDVIIIKIVSVEDHPDADRLHVCKVDDGGKVSDVDRDENGYVQIVCGAPNVRAGMLAAWLPPKSIVPSTYGTDDPFVLSARPLRGVVSNGMMASPKELTLGDSHEGILEIVPDDDENITPGTRFAEAYHLDGDVVIDIENKMFTHRPDCFGWLGVAREIEGIQRRAYKSPDWYVTNPSFPDIEADELPLEVNNQIPQVVPRFVAITLRDIELKPSPVWLQVDLARVGLRPINNIVDFTNYFMLLTGQPIHAYDYDKVKALSGGDKAVLNIRFPHEGEKITLLNGKEIEPRAEAMMVAAGDTLACMGGAMGGSNTEVDGNTKNIIIEAANWDMYSMRKTAMTHGIFTDAVTRFNKGQSPLQNLAVAARIVDEIRRHAGGKVASKVIDDNHVAQEALERGSLHAPVTVNTKFVNDRLGWHLSAEEMSQLLVNVEFKVDSNGEDLTITAPFWRTDIEIPEDIVEEVGRLYGYDHLPVELPKRDLTPAAKNQLLVQQAAIRDALADAGANEVLTYTFVHGNLIDKTGQDRKLAFQLSNALSPDLQYYRMSLMPSLLDRLHPNIKAGHDHFAIFELGKAHNLLHADDDPDGLPTEFDLLGFAVTASDKVSGGSGAAFYEARTYLDFLATRFGVTFEYQPIEAEIDNPLMKPYDSTRSATVSIKGGEGPIGVIGEFKTSVLKNLKLPKHTAGFEINSAALGATDSTSSRYTALPRFPRVEQDLCLKVPASTPYAAVYQFVASHLDTNRPDKTYHTLTPLDIYQRDDDAEHKQITLRLQIASFERTLTDDEVSKLLASIAEAAQQTLQAERV
jgi:phenylalanyl-tRNA synthetase beta chain